MKEKKQRIQSYRTEKILGVKVNFINFEQILFRVENWVKSNKQYQITTPNPEHIVLAQNDYGFKKIINKSALAVADGIGLVWTAKLFLKKDYPPWKDSPLQKLSGIDLMTAFCNLAAQKKWRVFLLGGKNDSARKAAKAINNEAMKQCSNELEIKYYEGSKDIVNETISERKKVIKLINNFKPHLLFLAYGAPMQEKWIADNLTKLKVKIAMGVGGAFDYISGNVKRAPKIVRKIGLEWLWRLLNEPWRIKRQLRLIKFVWLIIKEVSLRGVKRRSNL